MGYVVPNPPRWPPPPPGTKEFSEWKNKLQEQEEKERKEKIRWKLKWHIISKEDVFLENL